MTRSPDLGSRPCRPAGQPRRAPRAARPAARNVCCRGRGGRARGRPSTRHSGLSRHGASARSGGRCLKRERATARQPPRCICERLRALRLLGYGILARLAASTRRKNPCVGQHWALRMIPRTLLVASALASSIWHRALSNRGLGGHAAFRSLVSFFLAFTKAAWSMTVIG